MTPPLRGIVPPMITPLAGADALDVDGLERLVDHLLDGGVHGLFLLGTTGEGPSLSDRLKLDLVRRTTALVNGRVPVLVGVSDPSCADALRLAAGAADAGAAAVVTTVPFYQPIGQAEAAAFLRSFARQSPLPVFAYNMPSHVKLAFNADTVRAILDQPNIVGLKDSSAGAACFHETRTICQSRRPDFSLLIGPEEKLAECVPLGAHGGVTGGANVFPRLFVELYEAAIAGEAGRVFKLQSQVLRLPRTIYSVSSAPYAAIRGIKGALGQLGICDDRVACPMLDLNEGERRVIAAHLRSLADDAPALAAAAAR